MEIQKVYIFQIATFSKISVYIYIHIYISVLISFTQARYSTNGQDDYIQAGRRVLKLKGVQFCKMQITRGLHYFKMAFANDTALIEELQDYEDDESSEDDDEMDEEDDMVGGGSKL